MHNHFLTLHKFCPSQHGKLEFETLGEVKKL
jgi:hypothetical protein